MTPERARLVANAILAGAAACAAVVVLRSPRLRRVAAGCVRTLVTATLPAHLVREIRSAWHEAGAGR